VTDAQVLRTLFHANVSTRRQITQVSGRGLGLHVVQTSIEGLGGSVTVHSKRGGGAAFHLTVPVTLAMTSVVLFSLGQSRYALPAAAVVGLVAASACPPVASTAGPAVRYNGRVVPLLRLDEALAEPTQPTPTSGSERLMIVSRGRDLLALSGTSHHSEREVVLKSSGRFFARNRLVTAAVPMADGSLALVLSVAGIPTRAAGAGRPPHAAPTRQQTVLVADDSPVVRDLLAEALRAHGLRVLEASDGHEALQQLDAEPQIDLVVTDVDMPRLDGIGLLQQIRHRGGPRRLPVVIVSMRGSDQDQRRALSAGADAYLVKTDLSHAGLWSMLARFLS
jgi:CheY-like chemotaxis protein